jgi:D-glycero-alpha-D-manno-heptose 1-phosphate guanylyltransferase
MEAIVLAGGFGTRLQSVINDIAKPMAPINNKPFLAYLMEYLKSFGTKRVVLSVGYKRESIQAYFKDSYLGVDIDYSIEETPLGTGGAIKKALQMVDSTKILVMNGDTFFDLEITRFFESMNHEKIALALKPMINFDRYGSIVLQEGKVIAFEEKKAQKEGLINAGVYLIDRTIFQNTFEEVFSFESFLQQQQNIGGYISDGYFIDIGIPEDYLKAQHDFKELF